MYAILNFLRWLAASALAGLAPRRRVRYRRLHAADATQMKNHLMRLSPDDRHSRFHYFANDNVVTTYVDGIDFEERLVIGAFVGGELRGIGEAAPTGPAGEGIEEVALSVERSCQNRQLGTRILILLLAARLKHTTVLRLISMRDNMRLLALTRKLGATISFSEEGVLSDFRKDTPRTPQRPSGPA